MDGWMDVWMDGWIDRLDGWMDGWMDRQICSLAQGTRTLTAIHLRFVSEKVP